MLPSLFVAAKCCMADNRLPCFVIGLGLGAALGLLVAPHGGTQTRNRLKESAEDGKDFVLRNSEELRKVAEAAIDRGKEAVEAQRATLESAYRAGMEAYRNASGER